MRQGTSTRATHSYFLSPYGPSKDRPYTRWRAGFIGRSLWLSRYLVEGTNRAVTQQAPSCMEAGDRGLPLQCPVDTVVVALVATATTMTHPRGGRRTVARTITGVSAKTYSTLAAHVGGNQRKRGHTEHPLAPRIRPREIGSPDGVVINRPNKQWQERRDGRSYMQEEYTERGTAIMSFLEEAQQDRREVNAHLHCGNRFVSEARKLQIQMLECRGVARAVSGQVRKTRYLHPLPRGHGP